jgi:hypothetical protein
MVESTQARVRDPQKVRAILDSYETRGIEFQVTGEGDEGTLEATFQDDDPDVTRLPEAVRADEHTVAWPDRDLDDDEWYRLWDQEETLFEAKGQEGLLALLGEVAAYLQTPLLILAAGAYPPDGCAARAWRVQPGAKEVEALDVSL